MKVCKECKNCLNYLVSESGYYGNQEPCEFLDIDKEGEDYGYIDWSANYFNSECINHVKYVLYVI